MLVRIQIILGQVIVLVHVTSDDQGLPLIHALDGLLVAGDEVQHLVIVHKLSRANLVALRQSQNGASIEIAVVFELRIVVCDLL